MVVLPKQPRPPIKNADLLETLYNLLGPIPYWNDAEPPDQTAWRVLQALGAVPKPPAGVVLRLESVPGMKPLPLPPRYRLENVWRAQGALRELRKAIATVGGFPLPEEQAKLNKLAQKLAPIIMKVEPGYKDWKQLLAAEQARWKKINVENPYMSAPERYPYYSDEAHDQYMQEWNKTMFRLHQADKSNSEKK